MAEADTPDWEPLRPELTQRGFTAITEIGRGGMGYVLRAWDPDLERWVAIKVITRFAASNPENVRRFRSEMRLLGRIHHPAVITVYDGTMRDDLAYFLMPYIPGGTLEQLINQRCAIQRPFAVQEVVDRLRPIAEALDTIHSMHPPVIHRDVKPSNILVPGRGSGRSNAVLTDFGISLVGGDTRFTSTGIVIGSEQYMAPDRFSAEHGDDDGGPAADNYALALIAWEMLTLTSMYSTMSRQNWRFGRRVPQIPHGRLAAADLGKEPALNELLATLLANDPRQRPASAVEALERLEQVTREQGTRETRPEEMYPWPARQEGAPEQPRPRKRRGMVALATVAVVAVGAVAAGFAVTELTGSDSGGSTASMAQWSVPLGDIHDEFPGIVPDEPGAEGSAGLACSPGAESADQFAQIVCGDEDLKVTLVEYLNSGHRDEVLGDDSDPGDEEIPDCVAAVKRGTAGEWILLSDDDTFAAFVTGEDADRRYSDLDYCPA